MRVVVLDAWAVIAFLRNEQPAGRIVAQYLTQAPLGQTKVTMSVVSLGEVLYRLIGLVGEPTARRQLLRFRNDSTPIDILGVRESLVMDAALLKVTHRLSYADGFAVATARDQQATLLTGDPEILALPRSVVRTRQLTRDGH